ncbi:multicopper oxidase-domain-containing protein [Mycena olivaceomarginata]|nr:multicopper oxidase-domain-containing protein [Mycena olivaceomarginata]
MGAANQCVRRLAGGLMATLIHVLPRYSMPDDDPDDEQVGLIAASNFDGEHEHEARRLTPRRPSRRKRVISACTVLVLLLLPFLFLLWMTTWVAPPHQEQPDTFALNPKFDQTAPPRTRVYRWTVSAVPVSGADVYVTNGLQNEGTSIHWYDPPSPPLSSQPIPNSTLMPLGTASPCLLLPFTTAAPASHSALSPVPDAPVQFHVGGWMGTTWWHGHTSMQHTDGLFGPLVIHHPDERRGQKYGAEHVLTLTDELDTEASGEMVRMYLAPAQRYDIRIERDKFDTHTEAFWMRARMVEEHFGYENSRHPALNPSTSVPSTSIPISGKLPLPSTKPGPSSRASPGRVKEWYELTAFNEWTLRPFGEGELAMSTIPVEGGISSTDVLTILWIFSIQRTHDLNWRSFINGTSWEVPPLGEAALVRDTAGVYAPRNEGSEDGDQEGKGTGVKVWPGDQLITTLEYGQTVDFVITNLDDGDHPFHLHGYAPWLLGTGHGRYKAANAHLDTVNPLRRDTFTVMSRGWAVVRIVADNPGYWAWHMIGGGLFQIAVPPAEAKHGRLTLPDDIVEQCRMWGA